MAPQLSVVVCTFDPREDVFHLVLDALRRQTLPKNLWELVIVDNASSRPVRLDFDISWHSKAKIVEEPIEGLTIARLAGARETCGELVIYVDDDNVLNWDYLERALEKAYEHPGVGAFSGNISGRFELAPPKWIENYLWMLAVVSVCEDEFIEDSKGRIPCGAGLCVRRSVLDAYVNKVSKNGQRLKFGGNRSNLERCEDSDLALTALDIGLKLGFFKSLSLDHLLPASRTKWTYMLRLSEANGYSSTLLKKFRGEDIEMSKREMSVALTSCLARFARSPRQRQEAMDIAWQKGINRALRRMSTWNSEKPPSRRILCGTSS